MLRFVKLHTPKQHTQPHTHKPPIRHLCITHAHTSTHRFIEPGNGFFQRQAVYGWYDDEVRFFGF